MHRNTIIGAALLAAALVPASAQAADPLKIGIILPYSGQFADTAKMIDAGIKLYMKEHGDTVAGRKIEVIRKDVGGIAPPVAKRLAEELVVRDKIDVLAGFVLTPNAIAACGVSAEAKKMMVIMNAATSIITTKSPYCVRTSFTLPMVAETLGAWAVKNGIKKAYTLVSDFAPGHDAEQGFINAFKAGGGEVVGSVRMAVANPDFSAYIQRAKDINPQSIFLFVPAGAQPAAFGKAFVERGMSTAKTRVLGTGELANDVALKQMGEASKGIITAWNYDHTHNSAKNKAFVAAYKKDNGGENPDFMSVGGYDGMHVIYEALKKTKGATGGDELTNAAKGMKWESPRGPMMIDPETNDVISSIYIRRVDKIGNDYRNVEIDAIPNVKDPVKEAMKKKKS